MKPSKTNESETNSKAAANIKIKRNLKKKGIAVEMKECVRNKVCGCGECELSNPFFFKLL